MAITQNIDLHDQLQVLLEQGNEEGARKFIDDHIDEFSPDAQQKIALALFEETLDEQTAARAVRDSVQKQGLEAAAVLDSSLKNLEDQLKINEIKEKLSE